MLTASILSGFAVALFAPSLQRTVPRAAASLLALFPLALTAHFAALAPSVLSQGSLSVRQEWIPQLGVALAFRLDGLSLVLALLVSGIGALVIAYAGEYLRGDPHAGRFQALMLAFLASMLGLVLADDLIVLFVFWELTSVSSYFLIGFHAERKEARAAALQALLVTGGGGLALLAGFILLAAAGGSLQLSTLLERGADVRTHALFLPAMVLVLLGAFTKSAQFPFHFWLPAAMEAPTPASAYLHAATMVKAGVYLLARTNPIFSGSDVWHAALVVAGATTMVVGAWRAIVERSFKRILAYSTVGALGALVLMLGLGSAAAVGAAVAFLLAHALYKGALFLVAGAVHHETGATEVDRVGGLGRRMPLTAVAAGLAALSMAGVPPVLGFISKELLYGAALGAPRWAPVASLAAVLGGISLVAVALLTGARPFFGSYRETPERPNEAVTPLWGAPLLLAAGGLALGVWPAPASTLVAAASAAILPGAAPPDLSLWHGAGWPLALGATSLALGVAAYRGRARLRRIDERIGGARWGPSRGYDLALAGMLELARRQTRVLQSGSLRAYLLIILGTTVAAVGYTLIGRGGWPGLPDQPEVRFHEAALALLVVLAAVAAVRSSSRFGAIAAMGIAGYGIALIFLLFGAPDLAMTQFVVETLTVVVFVLAFHRLPRYAALSARRARAWDLMVCATAGLLMAALVLVSSSVELGHRKISHFYVDNAVERAHGRNIVNVILVDFRGLDTLGEITVLAIAGFGVLALLKVRRGEGGER